MRKLLYIAIVLLFASCGTARKMPKVVQVPVHTKTTVKDRITPVALPEDSASLSALFYCDSLNQVRLAQINELKTANMQSQQSFKNGKLTYRIRTVHDTVYIHGKDSIVLKQVPYKVEVPVVTYRQTAIQRFLSIVGAIALALVVLFIAIKFFKPI